MKFYFFVIILSGMIAPLAAQAYAKDIETSKCFDYYLESGTNDEKFYYLKKCLDLFRQQQPLAPANNQFNYDPNRNSTVLVSHLLYFAKEQPPGTQLSLLQDLKEKARHIVNSSNCTGESGLGKVWCGRLSQLANMSTAKIDNSFYSDGSYFLRSVKPEDVIDYTICVKGASSLASRKKVCNRVCKEGHKYKFTCAILESLKTIGRVESHLNDKITACYKNHQTNGCISLCESSGDIMACGFDVVEARNQEVLDSAMPITASEDDNSEEADESKLRNLGKKTAHRINEIYRRADDSGELNEFSSGRYHLEVSPSSVPTENTQPKLSEVNNKAIQKPAIQRGGATQLVNMGNPSISTNKPFQKASTPPVLPYNSVIQPKNINISKIGGAKKRSYSQVKASKPPITGGVNTFTNNSPIAVSSKAKKRRSVKLPYKKYRDNIGSHSYHAHESGVEGAKNDQIKKSKDKQKRSLSKYIPPSDSSLKLKNSRESLEENLKAIDESFFSPEYLNPGQSLFDKQNRVYQGVKQQGILNRRGQ